MRFWLLTSILFVSSVVAHGAPEEAMFGVDPDSQEWQRLELENWLKRRGESELAPFMNAENYRLQVKVTFEQPKPQPRTATYINVPLLGTVATVDTRESVKKPKTGIFAKVGKVEIMLAVNERVSEEAVQSATSLLKGKVPVVSQDKIDVQVTRFQNPPMTASEWVREFKGPLSALLLMLVFIGSIFLLIPRLRFQTYIKVGPSTPHGNNTFALVKSSPLVALPAPVAGDEPDPSILPKTFSVEELRRLKTAVSVLTIPECISIINSNSTLGSLVISLLPPDKSVRILGHIPEALQDELTMKTLEWDPETLPQEASALMVAIQKIKDQSRSKLKTVVNAAVVDLEETSAPASDVELEGLIRSKRYKDAAKCAYDLAPLDVIPHLPHEILRSAFCHLSYMEKVFLISKSEPAMQDILCPSNSSDPLDLQVRAESERVPDSPAARKSGEASWAKLVGLIRESIARNSEYAKLARPHIDHWLWEHSGGHVGQAFPGKKGKKHHGAA